MKTSNISNLAATFRRFYSTVRRKYPVNPDHVKSLPVFDYGTSNPTYKRIFVFGNARTGALGVPYLNKRDNTKHIECYRHPKRLGFGEKYDVKDIACGFGFTVFACNSDSPKLYGTGINTDCQIGYHAIRAGKPMGIIFFPQPIPLPLRNPRTKILKLAAGRAHVLVLTEEGLFLFGNNAYGQCGRRVVDNEDYGTSNFINHIATLDGKRIVDVQCGQDHSIAVTEDGGVYSCGWGADGQTGLGHYNNVSEFTRLQGDIAGERIVQVAGRCDFVMALNDKGEAFGWGNTEYAQLTLPDDTQQLSTPTHISMLSTLGKIKSVGAGGSFCACVNEDRDVFVWGYGILGTGPAVTASKTPVRIPKTLFGRNEFQPDCTVESVLCGVSHILAITNFGDLYSWGKNRKGCLGLGNEKDQYFPLKVAMGGSVKHIASGIDHTVVLCRPFV